MTNLTTIASTTKKFGPIIAFIALISILALIIFFRYTTKEPPPKVPILEKLEIESLPQGSITFNTNRLNQPKNIPESLPVYKPGAPINFLDIASSIATRLKIDSSPQPVNDINLGQGQIYSADGSVLSIYKEIINYQKIVRNKPSIRLNIDSLKIKALDYIKDFDETVNSHKYKTSFLKISGEDFVNSPSEQQADYVKFDFNYEIGSFPVVSGVNQATVILDFAGNVIKASLRGFAFGESIANYPIISFIDSLNYLKTGKGMLIAVAGEEEDASSQKDLGNVSLTEAYLAYYLPTKPLSFIQPIWVFEGQIFVNELPTQVIFALPAVDAKLINSPKNF